MLLRSVGITNFLSINGSTKLLLDKTITVLLGSNDHGKSNLLKAIQHLNEDRPISQEEVNWDATAPASLDFTFSLSESERKSWSQAVKDLRGELAQLEAAAAKTKEEGPRDHEPTPPVQPRVPTTGKAVPTSSSNLTDKEEEDEDEVVTRVREIQTFLAAVDGDQAPKELLISRRGVDAELSCLGIEMGDLPQEVCDIVSEGIPRVELIRTLTGDLQDTVSAAQLNTEQFEFMQGLFFYAGLDPAQASTLFVQNDETERRIQEASKLLDGNLRRLWGQGTYLQFSFAHRKDNIEFFLDDPTIKNRKARMSQRSDGVTQFFRTSIVLHARRKKHPANSYLYLFDEPGVYLHPQGQKDLMQVFEQLGAESQIVYATHSLFMLNQNFPERHRLIMKDNEGTKVDSKPHRANWRLATDALGVFLTSNILFSSHVLFVEGDSDPLYLYELFRQMNHFGELDADANRLGIMSFSDVQNLRFLLQMIKREDAPIQAIVLFDGDDAGDTTSERVKPLCDRLNVKQVKLEKGKSIEDYCFHEESFATALVKTLREAKGLSSEKTKLPQDFDTKVRDAWDSRKAAKPTQNKGDVISASATRETTVPQNAGAERMDPATLTAGRWFQVVAKKLIEDEASKVALARSYILACREVDEAILKKADHALAKKLCRKIADGLSLPKLAAE